MKHQLNFLLVTLAAVVISGCTANKAAAPPALSTVNDVALRTAERATVPNAIEAVGTVRARRTAQLGAQTMGNIVVVSAREGDHVQRGQLLAIVDPSQSQAAFDRATAGLAGAKQERVTADADCALAESTLQRYEKLFVEKSVTPQEIDEIRTRAAAARARRELAAAAEAQATAAATQAKTALDYTRVRAPFDGIVTSRLADLGTLVAPGSTIFTVEDAGGYRLEVTVNESDVALARLGASTPVIVANETTPRAARIVEIVPAADPASRSFLVKLELPASTAVRSGMFGRAVFVRGTRQAITIPQTAVLKRGQLQAVYIVAASGTADLRYVTLGQPFADGVEVLSGLEPGERFVVTPGDRDLAGKRIEVQ